MNDFDIELEYLDEQLRSGEITTREYNSTLRDLEDDWMVFINDYDEEV